jgi:hypothetical protein
LKFSQKIMYSNHTLQNAGFENCDHPHPSPQIVTLNQPFTDRKCRTKCFCVFWICPKEMVHKEELICFGKPHIESGTLHNEMRPIGAPHACTGVRTSLLPCAVKRLYLFSQSSLIMYSPRALNSELYANIGLFLPTPVSFFDPHALPVCVFCTQCPYTDDPDDP